MMSLPGGSVKYATTQDVKWSGKATRSSELIFPNIAK
jgi:hypothetical protein